MRYVAISDIHGEYDKLTRLMNKLSSQGVDFDNDTLVFLGDYIDGGPDTKIVVSGLQILQNLYPHWVMLKGNHEDMLANAYFERGAYGNDFLMWYLQGGMETHNSYREPDNFVSFSDLITVKKDIPEGVVRWLDQLPLFYDTPHFFFVHAGVTPGQPAHEVSDYEALWARNKFIKSKFDWGKRIIFGHTVANNGQPLVMPNKLGLDCMRHGYGRICAAILDEESPNEYEFVFSD